MSDNRKVNLVFLATILFEELFSVVLSLFAVFGIDITFGKIWAQLVYSQGIFVIPMLIYLIFFNKSFKLLRFKKIKFLDIMLCILLYLCIMPILSLLNLVSQLYSTAMITDTIFGLSKEVPFIIGLLLVAVMPAVCEEAVNRGMYYNTYRKTSTLGAVVVSGLIFGLIHGNLNQFTYAFVLGMFFAMIVEATDSIWSSISIHFCVNAVSVVTIYLMPLLLDNAKILYESAAAEGDTMTMSMIESAFGTEFSTDAILNAGTALTKADILASIPGYAIASIIAAVPLFFIYRLLAKRCGRWDIICDMFRSKKNRKYQVTEDVQQPVYVNPVSTPENVNPDMTVGADSNAAVYYAPAPKPRKDRIITGAWIAAAAILVIDMVLYELIAAGVLVIR